jgi:hypothetical protein
MSKFDCAALDLRGALDLAIMLEEDAESRYAELSRLLGDDPGGAGDVFRAMVALEREQRRALVGRREALFRGAPPRRAGALSAPRAGASARRDPARRRPRRPRAPRR